MKIKRKILIMIPTLLFLLVGCNDESTKVELQLEQSEVKETSSYDEDIEHHTPYIDEDSGEIDVETLEERYNNVNKEELTYDTLASREELEYMIEEHNLTHMSKIHLAEPANEDTSYSSILEGYSYLPLGNPLTFTYDEAIELAKKVLPNDIEKVDCILDKEDNIEYIYYKSSKGNFRLNLYYTNDISDKDIDEIHSGYICGITYSKEFK